jgi:hypothetical protein
VAEEAHRVEEVAEEAVEEDLQYSLHKDKPPYPMRLKPER